MSSDLVIIESGAIETRAARIQDGEPRRFWFGPAIGAEDRDHAARRGRRFYGRVVSIDRALDAAFVDIGQKVDAYLPLGAAPQPVAEGDFILATVAAPARQRKGPQLSMVGTAQASSEIGRTASEPPPVEAARSLGAASVEYVVDYARARNALVAAGFKAHMAVAAEAASLFKHYGADDALDTALARRVPLAGGGALIFDEAEALTTIDVDSGAVTAASTDAMRERLVVAAAQEAARQISRRNLAGRIAVDFPSIRARTIRDRTERAVETILRSVSGVSSIAMSRGNFTIVTVERTDLSLWDQTTETVDVAPVPGRRFTTAWIARRAIAELEAAIASAPSGQPSIRAGAALYEFLEENDHIAAALFDRVGVSLQVSLDTARMPRDYEICSAGAR